MLPTVLKEKRNSAWLFLILCILHANTNNTTAKRHLDDPSDFSDNVLFFERHILNYIRLNAYLFLYESGSKLINSKEAMNVWPQAKPVFLCRSMTWSTQISPLSLRMAADFQHFWSGGRQKRHLQRGVSPNVSMVFLHMQFAATTS